MGMVSAGVVGLFGVLSAVGGVLGYQKARSRASLIAGVSAGLLLALCAIGLTQGSRPAALGSLFVALLLGGRFGGLWRRKRRLMPDLIMFLMSVLTVVTVGATLLSSLR